jgi:hypothetical protein
MIYAVVLVGFLVERRVAWFLYTGNSRKSYTHIFTLQTSMLSCTQTNMRLTFHESCLSPTLRGQRLPSLSQQRQV